MISHDATHDTEMASHYEDEERKKRLNLDLGLGDMGTEDMGGDEDAEARNAAMNQMLMDTGTDDDENPSMSNLFSMPRMRKKQSGGKGGGGMGGMMGGGGGMDMSAIMGMMG